VTTILRGHSDPYGRLRDAPIAIALPRKQIYKQRAAIILSSSLFTHHPSFCPCVIRNINSSAKRKDKGNSAIMRNAKTRKKRKLQSALIFKA
jgi:hypothetical protein